MGAIRLGIDIGGTFTDITVLEEDTGGVTVAKVPSRKSDPGGALINAIERGLELAAVDAGDVTMLVHGTTIVTNAVLEKKLPRTALLTTHSADVGLAWADRSLTLSGGRIESEGVATRSSAAGVSISR